MLSNFNFRAGAGAAALIQERGLRAKDVDIVPGASGEAKWLSIGGLDRFLFGDFSQAPRVRPMRLIGSSDHRIIGSSIGNSRMACLAQRDPVAALARGHHGYIYDELYSKKPSPNGVTGVLTTILNEMLGPTGVDEILSHPWAELNVITAMTRRLPSRGRRAALAAALGAAALGNLVSRRMLGLQIRRFVFHSGDTSPFEHLADLPTLHAKLTRENARDVLLASGAIPMVVEGVEIPRSPA